MAEADREKWDRRHAAGPYGAGSPPDWLAEFAHEFPEGRRALDVATGTGRIALWLARFGFDVTAVDISPVGLEQLSKSARAASVTVRTVVADLERDLLPEGPWDLITCVAYLRRELFPAMRDRLVPGGLLICGLPTIRNLERHTRPPARFLIGENELLQLCAPLQIVYYREGWVDDRAVARVIARKPRPTEG